MVHAQLSKELEVSTMQAKIQSEAQDEMSKSQREYYLREQLRAIRKELGDAEDRCPGAGRSCAKTWRKMKPCPRRCAPRRSNSSSRLEQMQPEAAEATIIRTYLDWIQELPWGNSTRDRLDVLRAQKILDEDHYDLEKVKERILEHLAVRKLNPKMKGPILCFIGPPGVGKTSLGRSIARAMGSKFVRMSLGGVQGRGRDKGAPPHLHRRPAGQDHPGHEDGRVQQPGVHDRRGGQGGQRISGETPPPPCWRFWTPSRTTPSPTII